jgi:hypothetical protein
LIYTNIQRKDGSLMFGAQHGFLFNHCRGFKPVSAPRLSASVNEGLLVLRL